jgi:Recombination endonuclease VII
VQPLGRDQLTRDELMEQLLLIPSCEKHGGLKVWINDRSKGNGGFYRCRECHRVSDTASSRRQREDPVKAAEMNAYNRSHYHSQPVEKRAQKHRRGNEVKKARRAVEPEFVERLKRQNREYSAKHPVIGRNCKLKKTYGITVAEFDKILAAQGGRCAVCRTDDPGGRGHFHVDHCHQTGAVRGVLCHRCNTGIGLLGDNLGSLLAAVEYLSEAALGAVTRTAA